MTDLRPPAVEEPPAVTEAHPGDGAAWRQALVLGGIAYLLSRALVLGAASVAPASRDPRPPSALRGILDVLTSWDGLWYLRITRIGYPRSVPPGITYFQDEARAAFFPLFPTLARGLDAVLPGGDTFAALVLNVALGAGFVLAVGLLTRRLAGAVVAGRAMVLTALFPGSFVLSFAYSEAVMLLLAALTLLWLLDRRWVLAGLAAALAGLSRPNAVALVAACAVASFLAIRRRREWRSLAAPLLAPLGLVSFQLFLWQHTGEAGVWFRVQREAWDEGVSFGWTALTNTAQFFVDPFDSATDAITVLVMAATVALVWFLVKARLPAPMVTYTAVILAMMLMPATVTARPRFLYTAFPLLIATAMVWPRRSEAAREGWSIALAVCGGGLVAVTALYGVYAAIP